ncbi:hypothetical protein M427DRAFT_30074 [Gonapodya prolifera JEL478]|uniref:Uncharacterized protein n=1 Tax=Gonapodya prolifera (strain JEL478) TaxID=1344416 RepID=A0A139AN91_GONPJ|nr:hypothetical protein M427DRAFT_30074 [Gonapodya prolifera JEL478]|eukprot:KXS17965.1 hypothetical protein M427DRAFT_30074 [Gonapodya prolifera JEL478]
MSPDALIPSLGVLKVVSEGYPIQFGIAFEDIIDLLVGWYVEPTTSDNAMRALELAFLSYIPFWLRHLSAALQLLGHLLHDAEVATEQINGSLPEPGEAKCFAILRCAFAILHSLFLCLTDVAVADAERSHMSNVRSLTVQAFHLVTKASRRFGGGRLRDIAVEAGVTFGTLMNGDPAFQEAAFGAVLVEVEKEDITKMEVHAILEGAEKACATW